MTREGYTEVSDVMVKFCFFKKKKKTYLFLAAPVFTALRGLSLAAASGGYTLVAVRGLLIASASLAVKHTLQGTLSSLVVAC